MALHVAQVILPMFTSIPEDVIVNRFHFQVLNISSADGATEIASRLKTFYEEGYGSAAQRVSYVDWPLASVKVFNLEDTPPRIPEVRSLGITTAGSSATAIPTEVATVLSWHAAPESGVRFQRLYNRIYLGAMPTAAITLGAVDAFPTLSIAWRGQWATALEGLLAEDDIDVRWRQVSSATGSPVDRTITGGWIDNSPDTQRRRSVLPSARTNWG